MFCHGNPRKIILYTNRYTNLNYEKLFALYNHSSNNINCDCSINSAIADFISILNSIAGYLKLDRNLRWYDFLRIHLGRSVAFFIGQREKTKREKRTKLLRHYSILKQKVLTKWLSFSANTLSYIENFCPCMCNLYLATWLTINGSDVWHKWMMQHIYDEEGYPHIQSLFKKLETHEKNHNSFVSSLIKTLNDEAKSMLRAFPNLKEYESGIADNFYNMNNIFYALHNPNMPLKIFEERELYVNSDRRIAKSDSETLQKLKTEIERIRSVHKEDFEKVDSGIKTDKQLLDSIQRLVDQIVYELALEKPLKGRCDYELSLDK